MRTPDTTTPAAAHDEQPTVAWEGELAATDPPLGIVAAESSGSPRSLILGVVILVVGVVVAYVGASVLEAGLFVRLLVAMAGIGLAYTGAVRIAARFFGPNFDLAFWMSVVWLVLVIGSAALAPLLPLGEHNDTSATLLDPTFQTPDLFSSHPLGTNAFGLDMLSRTIYGARVSLVVAVIAVIIGMVVGGSIGIVAGFFKGKVDATIGIFTNALLAVPPLILLIALATVLEPNIRNIALVLALLGIPGQIRIARANTLSVGSREFVTAARAMGATRWRLIYRELLPSVAIPLMTLGMVIISVLIVAEASLSFLGLGIQPPDPSWGNMISEGQEGVLELHPHVVLVPGVVLFLTVFAFNLVGEKLRARLDPRGSKL